MSDMGSDNRVLVPFPCQPRQPPSRMSAFVRILSPPRISPPLRPPYNLPDDAHLLRATVIEELVMLAIGILMFDDVEVLDFSGPFEVFSTAARVHGRRGGNPALFRCFLVSAGMKPIRARGGMKVLPDCVLPPPADLDLLIVPGGDVGKAMSDPVLINWIRAQAARCDIIASVCTGAFLLGEAGLLDGLPVTTHWEDQDALRQRFVRTRVRADTPWIDCGRVVTSAGISAGIDMSLHLVERLAGRPLAQATARQMEYEWNSDGYCKHSLDDRQRRADAGLFSAA